MATEGADPASIVLRRGGVADRGLQVVLRTAAGTATPGLDYLETAITVTFATGETNRVVTVPLLDDGDVEPEETVRLLVSAVPGSDSLTGRTEATLTLLDNEQVAWVDAGFQTEFPLGSQPSELAPAPDGRLVVAGYFPTPGPFAAYGIVRLNADGSTDRSFTFETLGPAAEGHALGLQGLAVQKDGAVLVGYWFQAGFGQQTFGLARLRPDGSPDPGFHADLRNPTNSVSPNLLRFGLQPDGRIIAFLQYQSPDYAAPISRLVRLQADGSIDPVFRGQQSLGSRLDQATFRDLTVQTDGAVLVSLGPWSGASQPTLWRLLPDGTLDTGFECAVKDPLKWAPAPGGGLVVAFLDFSPDGGGPYRMARLRPDGSRDPAFAPTSFAHVYDIEVGNDGTVVVAGSFTELIGRPRCGLARLLPDGLLDPRFRGPSCGTSAPVGAPYSGPSKVQILEDGRILILGWFSEIEGFRRPGLARLNGQLSSGGGPEWTSGFRTVDEAAGEVVLPLRRTGDANQEVLVRYRTVDGSAKEGADFLPAEGVVRFAPLQSESEIRIPLVNDVAVEAEEDFHVVLEPVDGAALGQLRDAEVRILDNDLGIQFGDYPTAATEGEAFASIPVFRTGDDGREIRVEYVVAGGTATAGKDYAGTNGVVTFAAGAFRAIVRIPLLDDGLAEGEETIEVRLVDRENREILGRTTNAIVVLHDNENQGLRVDPDFVPTWQGFAPAQAQGSSGISELRVQHGERILLGTWVQDTPDSRPRSRIVRLDAHGAEDPTFVPGTNTTALLAVAGDDSILALADTGLVRFLPDGALDPTFQNRLGTADGSPPAVRGAVIQSDGKIVIWGGFTSVNGIRRTNVARLERDGSLDSGFLGVAPVETENPEATVEIADVQQAPDGRCFVATLRITPSHAAVPRIGEVIVQRWDEQGIPDPGFRWTSGGDSGLVLRGPLLVLPEGGLVVNISVFGRYSAGGRLVRLGPDGSATDPFGTLEPASYGLGGIFVAALARQADGHLLVWVQTSSAFAPGSLVLRRLLPDGSPDRDFQPGATPSTSVDGFRRVGHSAAVAWGSTWRPDGTWRPDLVKLDVASAPAAGARFSSDLATASEGDAEAVLSVVRLGDTTGRMVLDHVTEDGSAQAGLEYQPRGEPLVFEPLQTVGYLRVPLLDNPWPDLDTTFSLELRGASNRVVTVPPGSRVKFRILDDDRPGALDPSFIAGNLGYPSDGQGSVAVMRRQPDGRILAAGSIPTFQSQERLGMVRVQSDGTIDPTFRLETDAADGGAIRAMAVQGDGRILIGGGFSSLQGVPRLNLARLLPDGTVDPTFDPQRLASSWVEAITLQSDGRALVAGQAFSTGDTSLYGVVRLQPDGSLDPSFAPAFPSSTTIHSLVVLGDDRVLAGGWIDSVGGVTRQGLVRLHADGRLDPNFNANQAEIQPLQSFVVGPDGFVLVNCPGPSYLGVVVRLDPTGMVDRSFSAPTGLQSPTVVLPDGRVLVTRVTWTFGPAHTEVLRLNRDGSIDPTFVGPAFEGGTVASLLEVADGRVLVGGSFTATTSPIRASVIRLHTEDPPPVFSRVSRTPQGAKLTLHGLPGRRHLIEASDDLAFWMTVTEVTPPLEGPSFRRDLEDTGAAGIPHRFYRATRLAP